MLGRIELGPGRVAQPNGKVDLAGSWIDRSQNDIGGNDFELWQPNTRPSVVIRPQIGLAKNPERLVDPLHLLFSGRVSTVEVRVELAGQALVSRLNDVGIG